MPSITIRTDATARARASAILPVVHATNPEYELDDVYAGAARIGLTRLTSQMPGREVHAVDLAPIAGTAVENTAFDLPADLDPIATVLASALFLPKEQVVGAAAVLGLALLSSVDPGPFTLGGASRQIARPFF